MYLSRGCTCPGDVPAQGGVPAWGVYLPRGCTCPGGVLAEGVPAWGVPDRGQGTCPEGVPAQGAYLLRGAPAQGGFLSRYPPVNRMTDRWKILPCPKLLLRAVNIMQKFSWLLNVTVSLYVLHY